MPGRSKRVSSARKRLPVRGRRAKVRDPLKRGSYQMRASTMAGIKQAVVRGLAANASAFVEAAVVERLRAARRARRNATQAQAADEYQLLAELETLTQQLETLSTHLL
jgi:hypothetical protein